MPRARKIPLTHDFFTELEAPELIENLPDGSELFGVADSHDPIKIRTPDGYHVTRSVWDGIDPDDARDAFHARFGWFLDTPGACARRLVRESLAGVPLYRHNGYADRLDLVERFARSWSPGPIMRSWQREDDPAWLVRRIPDAVVADINAAYLWALCSELPYGSPTYWEGPVPDGLAGIVEVEVVDHLRLHGARTPEGDHAYPERYTYRGTWAEIARSVDAGRVTLVGEPRGHVWNTSSHGARLAAVLEPWRTSPDATLRHMAKLLYTRAWVTYVWPGYHHGVVERDPARAPEGYETERARPWLHWRVSSVSPAENPRMLSTLQRPDRAAHVIGAIRSELIEVAAGIVSRSGKVGQILVDCLIADAETLFDCAPIGPDPGQWRVEPSDADETATARGEYQGTTPGIYQIRGADGKLLRSRASGRDRLSWRQLDAMIHGD